MGAICLSTLSYEGLYIMKRFIYQIEKDEHLFAVLNINNMIPVPMNLCKEIDIDDISDTSYKHLLNQEYLICKRKKRDIIKSAGIVHKCICDEPESHENMLRYCCNFIALEQYCKSRA